MIVKVLDKKTRKIITTYEDAISADKNSNIVVAKGMKQSCYVYPDKYELEIEE